MRIKKLAHILMIFLLLIATAGVSINKHYSGGNLFSTSVFVEAKSCCETPCSCCKNTSELVQVKADFIASTFNLQAVCQLNLLFSIRPLALQFQNLTNGLTTFIEWDISQTSWPDLGILHQVFRL